MARTEKGNASTTFKESYYNHNYEEKEFIKNKYYDLFFINEDGTSELGKEYWLAGRYVHLYSNYCDIGMQGVRTHSSCGVYGDALYTSIR